MSYDRNMSVSERDRDYMRRLGEFQAKGALERRAEYQRLDGAERIIASVSFCQGFADQVRAPLDDPTPFYDRARRLGLYLP